MFLFNVAHLSMPPDGSAMLSMGEEGQQSYGTGGWLQGRERVSTLAKSNGVDF